MQTICFDLDGTLTDPKVGITQSIRYALTELTGAAPAAEELTWCIGPPLLGSFEKLLGDKGVARAEATCGSPEDLIPVFRPDDRHRPHARIL